MDMPQAKEQKAMKGNKDLLTKKFGKHGPEVPGLGFGCMGLSGAFAKQKPDDERYAVLDYAYQSGVYLWDTADAYADSEDLLGRWFQRNPGARQNVFLCTKFGNTRDPKTGMPAVRNDVEYMHQQLTKSLARLQTDQIDLYYAHRVDKAQPIEITVSAMKELRDSGKVKYLGLSEASADTLRRACKVAHIDAVQMEMSPFCMEVEQRGLMSACRQLGVAIVAYAPLGKGFLTGSIRSLSDLEEGDRRRIFPRFSEENFHKNLELVDKLNAIADRKGCTNGQLILAWLMKNPLVFPIPGTTQIRNLDENIGAFQVEITEQDDQEIRDAISSVEVAGGRYPEMFGNDLFADTVPLEEYDGSQKI
ncbi:hypothetical protein OHC33_004927 [Knufia fluminis]|uniref:NADP-dependent oxidoreductase domain-containing protein n=1 Tax=Knufia fluminis TaxID=191047 RepID=A0AAN8EFD0_9EURO|nr:hypothetical protein OHC33_004927 [Knufia fluminis]